MSKKTINELLDFSGKAVIVTGGAKGIGFAIARRFAEAKASVIIADIDEVVGQQKADDLKKEFSIDARFIKTDLSSEEEIVNLVSETIKNFGKIDVLINNAGIFPQKPVLEMDTALWDKIMSINLRGLFICSREAVKEMAKTNNGVIINIASVDALHPSMIGLAAYDASKHGVWGFTKNLALELAEKNIRINAIAPGGIQTEGVEEMTQGQIKANTDILAPLDVPLKRMGHPDEIATTALFLASDASSYMTGSIIVVDGGMLLG